MSDPVSVVGLVISVIVPAVQGVRALHDEIQHIKNAPHTLKNLGHDVESVTTVLDLFKDHANGQEQTSFGQNIAKKLVGPVTHCKEECEIFRTKLQRWQRHSTDGNLGFRDRATIAWNQEDIKAMSGELQSHKLTINNALTAAG
jgi:hypothetical protein